MAIAGGALVATGMGSVVTATVSAMVGGASAGVVAGAASSLEQAAPTSVATRSPATDAWIVVRMVGVRVVLFMLRTVHEAREERSTTHHGSSRKQ